MGRRKEFAFYADQQDHRVRRFFFKALLFLILIAAVIAAVNMVVSRQMTYETLSVTVPKLPDDLENWTIMHISDLHGMTYGSGQSGIATAVGTVNVSSVVITGDCVGKDGDVEPLLELLALMPSDKPKLYLPGDEDPDYLDATAHGSLSPLADWAEKLTEAGVTILDEPVLYTRGKKDQARIWFIPASLYTLDLDSMERAYQSQLDQLNAKLSLTADEAARKRVAEYQVARVARIRTSIAEIQSGDVQIAVSHAPVTQMMINDSVRTDGRSEVFTLRQVDLILSGHYCGGQVRIPGIGALYVPGMGWFPSDELITGYHYTGNVPQYISPGLGVSSEYEWWQKFRFMNPPVITRITLTEKAS